MPVSDRWSPRKRAEVAVVLGVLVPSFGQPYAGYPRRAVFWSLGAAALGMLTVNAMPADGYT